MRTVVLGGNGNFGGRIIRGLRGDPSFELIAASRSGSGVAGAPEVSTARLDIMAPDFRQHLSALDPQLVIHCIGPFQGQDYRVARAALDSGAHYLDLADGREFVAGFSRELDAQARLRRQFACTGASTLPALSTAVIDHLRGNMSSIEAVQVAIAPGQRAPRGAATLAAVFSYLGRPVSVWEQGEWRQRWGWMDLTRLRFAFGTRWAAVCDVPDLAVLPQRYPSLRSARFHAALEFGAQHFMLWLLAALRRGGLPVNVERHADALERVARLFDRWGGHWGGMQVALEGTLPDGSRCRRTWQLQAPALNGPEIPCMATLLLARRLASGEVLPAGAHACMGLLRLHEFEPLFRRWSISTRIEEQALPP
jgi:hypothetical protein